MRRVAPVSLWVKTAGQRRRSVFWWRGDVYSIDTDRGRTEKAVLLGRCRGVTRDQLDVARDFLGSHRLSQESQCRLRVGTGLEVQELDGRLIGIITPNIWCRFHRDPLMFQFTNRLTQLFRRQSGAAPH